MNKKVTINAIGMNAIVNTLTFCCLAIVALTGLFVLGELHGDETLLGLDKHTWEEMHERMGILLSTLILAHLFLHRHWIKLVISGRSLGDAKTKKQTIVAIGISLLVLLGIVAATIIEGL